MAMMTQPAAPTARPSPSFMWVMACTLTAVTTSSARPCPAASIQNAWVRSASRAVNSGWAAAAWAAADWAAGGTPSTCSPMVSGRLRITPASHQPMPSVMTPQVSAVARQPKRCMDAASKGTASPPSARPMLMMDSARARWARNH